MATVSKDLGGNDVCRYSLEYDDVTLWVTGVRCVTTSRRTGVAPLTLIRTSDGAEFAKAWASNQDTRLTFRPITRTDERIQLAWETKGDGVTQRLGGFTYRKETPGA